MTIEILSAAAIETRAHPLVALLQDAVDSGASVGFLPPLRDPQAREYWESVRRAVEAGTRVVLAAIDGEALEGSVQLDLAAMPNARHRTELMKLFVHRSARRKGIARMLMSAAEEAARALGRTLLTADTRRGSAAEQMCLTLGYIRVGVIPRYAMSAAGTLDDTVFFYRELPAPPAA